MHILNETHCKHLQAGAMAVLGSNQIELANCDLSTEKDSDKENDPLLVTQKSYGTIVLLSKSCTRPSTPGGRCALYVLGGGRCALYLKG